MVSTRFRKNFGRPLILKTDPVARAVEQIGVRVVCMNVDFEYLNGFLWYGCQNFSLNMAFAIKCYS